MMVPASALAVLQILANCPRCRPTLVRMHLRRGWSSG
jgi:hypothetical protein